MWGIAAALAVMGASIFSAPSLSHEEVKQSLEQLHESLRVALIVGDPWLIAWALYHLGYLIQVQGDTERAMTLHQEGLEQARVAGDPWLVAWAVQALATLTRIPWGFRTRFGTVLGKPGDPAQHRRQVGHCLVSAPPGGPGGGPGRPRWTGSNLQEERRGDQQQAAGEGALKRCERGG